MHYVYVLRSASDDGFYIGYSTSLRKRLEQHAKGKSLATSYRRPWKLIYYEAYLNQRDAVGRERYLKSGAGRKFLKAQLRNYLAEGHNRLNRVAYALRDTRMFSIARELV
jgi:putative endonuclease